MSLKDINETVFQIKMVYFFEKKKKITFVFHPTSRKPVKCGRDCLCFWGQSERQIGGNKIFISSHSTRRVNNVMKIMTQENADYENKKRSLQVLSCGIS